MVQLLVLAFSDGFHDSWQDVACHTNYTVALVATPLQVVVLVIIAGPGEDALLSVLLYSVSICALLHSGKVVMFSNFHHGLWLDVLISPTWHVVNDSRAVVHQSVEVIQNAIHAGLAVVWVYLQTTMHSSIKAGFGCLMRLLGVETAGISYDGKLVAVFLGSMPDEANNLILLHEVTLSSRSADNQSLNAVSNLVLDVSIECSDVELTRLSIGCLDGSDQLGLLDTLFIHLVLCRHLNGSWPPGRGDLIVPVESTVHVPLEGATEHHAWSSCIPVTLTGAGHSVSHA